MMIDGVPFENVWDASTTVGKSIVRFVRFLERQLGARMYYDARAFQLERPELSDLFDLAKRLKGAGIITSVRKVERLPDEPLLYRFNAELTDDSRHVAGGTSHESERAALIPALAEAQERY